MNGGATALSGGGPIEERLRKYIDRMCAKDSGALAEFYDETSGWLYSLAHRILNDPAHAEEIVMDVYQHVWRSAPTFDGSRGTVWSWLTILTRNRAIDRLRTAESRRASQIRPAWNLEMESGPARTEVQTMYHEQREVILRALETMSAGERTAIELAYFHGLTQMEIAEELGEPLGRIKTRICSGIRKLRDAI